MRPTVKLISCTANPKETIYAEWLQSRSDDLVLSAQDYSDAKRVSPELEEDIENTFWQVISMQLPPLETIQMVFLLEKVSIALREQIVRHRVGHHFGGRLGIDVVPNMTDSSFWSQSMRVKNMGQFAMLGEFSVPESIHSRVNLNCMYSDFMGHVQHFYNLLIAAGVPAEDARNVIPLAATHRMTWSLNLSSLATILRKRSCWIAQLGLWKPIIYGMVSELSNVFGPKIRSLIAPPCVKNGRWAGCGYRKENESRVKNEDPGVPCSLYLFRELALSHEQAQSAVGTKKLPVFNSMIDEYGDLWGMDAIEGPEL